MISQTYISKYTKKINNIFVFFQKKIKKEFAKKEKRVYLCARKKYKQSLAAVNLKR